MRSFFRAGCISQDFWFCQQQKWPCLDLQQGTVCHCRCKLLLHCGCWYRNRGRAPSTLAERAHHQTAFASKECSGNRGPRGCVNAGKRLGNAAAASSQSRRSPCTHTHTCTHKELQRTSPLFTSGCMMYQVAECMHMHDVMTPYTVFIQV